MKKFAVFSGFLGSGKTTTMMALTKYYMENYGKAAMISNDLGGSGLADHRFASLAGCNASELTGDCICYQTENLVERLDILFDGSGCELVVSDIPGFGVGALDHVYHTLERDYAGRYELAPFTVLVEPRTVGLLRDGRGGDMEYILNTQLVEADLIVLNKSDLITPDELEREKAYLKENYPQANIIAISALNGQGMDELSRTLRESSASMRLPDIGYGDADFANAMGKISEYNIQYYVVVCCNTFDGNLYQKDLAEAIQYEAGQSGVEIPHLKLLAWEPEGDYSKVDLLGVDCPIEQVKAFASSCTELAVVLNASAACPDRELDRIITGAVVRVSEEYQLTLAVYKKECFGMVS